MPEQLTERLISWAPDLDAGTLEQAARTSRLGIVAGHVALMPDAHRGLGSTVGSVVPTHGAVIPACVGVDIGCGMAAARTDLYAEDLPDSLTPMLSDVARAIPAGVGKGHDSSGRRAFEWLDTHRPRTTLTSKQEATAVSQLGTLGSGNHFAEVSLDEDDRVWAVLHSGSRGIGNQLAQSHIATAKAVTARNGIGLEDPDLAYLVEGTDEFDHYITDLLWAQDYAATSRQLMLERMTDVVFRHVGKGRVRDTVNCHHNYTVREHHQGRDLWVTRKGAIRARTGDLGIIPGSMGTDTFIVEGLGNPAAFESSAHGAGRTMSRTKAKKTLDEQSLRDAMAGRTWLEQDASRLVDEHPSAYKDINQVMARQADLVTVRNRLTAVLNYKGT